VSDAVLLPDGRRVQLWQGGAGDGPTVIFLHGCPDSRWAAWLGDPPARRAGVRLLAPNRPGYGTSDGHASTPESVADDVVAVADTVGATVFAVLGMSVGGIYALATAARHPGRVTALAAVSAPGQVAVMDPPHHRDGLSQEEADQIDRLRAARTSEEAVEMLRPEYETFLAQMRVPRQELAARWTAQLSTTDRELLDVVPEAVLAAQAEEALARPDGYLRDAAALFRPWEFDTSLIRCPVTVVHGGRDTRASVRNARWLGEHVPGARVVEKPEADHLGALHESWEELLDLLRGVGQAERSTNPDS
jgi:pimeloyl-ACP methyl ester carboxylesterase